MFSKRRQKRTSPDPVIAIPFNVIPATIVTIRTQRRRQNANMEVFFLGCCPKIGVKAFSWFRGEPENGSCAFLLSPVFIVTSPRISDSGLDKDYTVPQFRSCILFMVGRIMPKKLSCRTNCRSYVDHADSATQPRLHSLQSAYRE